MPRRCLWSRPNWRRRKRKSSKSCIRRSHNGELLPRIGVNRTLPIMKRPMKISSQLLRREMDHLGCRLEARHNYCSKTSCTTLIRWWAGIWRGKACTIWISRRISYRVTIEWRNCPKLVVKDQRGSCLSITPSKTSLIWSRERCGLLHS